MLFLVLVLTISVISVDDAPPSQSNNDFNIEIERLGVDSSQIVGCNSGCSYDSQSGVITLVPGALFYNPPDGMTIELNDGVVERNGITISGFGTFKSSKPDNLVGGLVAYSSLSSQSNLVFENSQIQLPQPAQAGITGTGSIQKGVLVLDEGNLQVETSVQHLTNVVYDSRSTDSNSDIFRSQEFNFISNHEGATIGDTNGFVSIEPMRAIKLTFSIGTTIPVLLVGKRLNNEGTGFDDSVTPTITIHGAPSISIKSAQLTQEIKNDKGQIFDIKSVPYKVNVNGKDHMVIGDLDFNKGRIFIPKNGLSDREKQRMVDGVYVSTSQAIPVFFDDKVHDGNFIALGNQLRAGGKGFKIALSQEGIGRLSPDFYHHFESSPYLNLPAGTYSPTKFIVNFDGEMKTPPQQGLIMINPIEQKIKSEGFLEITTGTHAVQYFKNGNSQQYNYKYVGCGGKNADDFSEFSCGALPYTFVDGGVINFVTEKKAPNVKVLDRGAPLYLKTDGSIQEVFISSGVNGEKITDFVQFDEDKVYMLAYRGGAAAAEIIGDDRAKEEWGHVGVMYYKGGKWWVAESDGVSAKIRQGKDSLFKNTADGVWLVVDDGNKPISPTDVADYAESLVGARYDVNPLTPQALHCTEVATACVSAGLKKPYEGRVTFNDISDMPVSFIAKSLAAGPVVKTPRWALGSPNLEELFVRSPPRKK